MATRFTLANFYLGFDNFAALFGVDVVFQEVGVSWQGDTAVTWHGWGDAA